MKAEIQADLGTIQDKAYCVLEINGYIFRLSVGDYFRLNNHKTLNHSKVVKFFQSVVDKINKK